MGRAGRACKACEGGAIGEGRVGLGWAGAGLREREGPRSRAELSGGRWARRGRGCCKPARRQPVSKGERGEGIPHYHPPSIPTPTPFTPPPPPLLVNRPIDRE